MKTIFILLFIIVIQCPLQSQNKERLDSLLFSSKIALINNQVFKEKQVIENEILNYDYAFEIPNSTAEIRLKILTKNYLRNQSIRLQVSEEILVNDNETYIKNYFECIQESISIDSDYDSLHTQVVNTEKIKKLFNADFGFMSTIRVNPKFAPNYKYCYTSLIHKIDESSIVIFMLFDSNTTEIEALNHMNNKDLNILKFK